MVLEKGHPSYPNCLNQFYQFSPSVLWLHCPFECISECLSEYLYECLFQPLLSHLANFFYVRIVHFQFWYLQINVLFSTVIEQFC